MHVFAVVVGVNKQRFSIDLSVKPSHLRSTEDYWMLSRLPDLSSYNDGNQKYNNNGQCSLLLLCFTYRLFLVIYIKSFYFVILNSF